jgi:hypothetical protein
MSYLAREKPEHPDKGKDGGRCNRRACQEPGAYYYNSGTRKYYCWVCAKLIQNAHADNRSLFAFPLTYDLREEVVDEVRLIKLPDGKLSGSYDWELNKVYEKVGVMGPLIEVRVGDDVASVNPCWFERA